MEPRIRRAAAAEVEKVCRLLEQAGLPTAGLREHAQTLFVLADRQTLTGAVAYEGYLPDALLRSLVVAPQARGRGHGRELTDFILAELSRRGYRTAYCLTTTIPELLAKRGFEEIRREDLPAALAASEELRGACPLSARVFRAAVTS